MSQTTATNTTATNGDGTQPAPTRRERVRAATMTEIKDLAWKQLADVGAAALSLRAIANEMGVTSSALYRYFASRDDLLRALIVDGFVSLADALESAEASLTPDVGSRERWLHLASAHRRWALDHPAEYSLVFGTPVPGLDTDSDECHVQMKRGVNVLFRCMLNGLSRGEFNADAIQATVTPGLQKRLGQWGTELEIQLPEEALAGCLFAWTHLHGAVALELFGHLPPHLQPADELFEQQMTQVVSILGASRT